MIPVLTPAGPALCDARGRTHTPADLEAALAALTAQRAANPPAPIAAVLEAAIAERRAWLAQLAPAAMPPLDRD